MEKFNENMQKIGKDVKKGLDESYYRFLTFANLAVNKVARPITDGGKFFAFSFHNFLKSLHFYRRNYPG